MKFRKERFEWKKDDIEVIKNPPKKEENKKSFTYSLIHLLSNLNKK